MMVIIGHRGAKGLAAENTLASFKQAIKVGVDQIECDVRVTADGIPVLAHDKRLKSSNGYNRPISNTTYHELLKACPDLTKLEDVLGFSKETPLYLEIKKDVTLNPIIKQLRRYPVNKYKILLGSKNQTILRTLHSELPDFPKIVIENFSGVWAQHRAKQLDTKQICMYQAFLWFGFIRAMSKRGYQLYAYTINDPVKANKWARYGLAGVVTDFPDRFS